jgi:hypothetical protein
LRALLSCLGILLLGSGCLVTFSDEAMIFECDVAADCAGDGFQCAPQGYCCRSEPEVCDGRDNNCDGLADEGSLGGTCYSGPPATLGKGQCKAGTEICEGGRISGNCVGEVLPAVEVCNLIDDDCDGRVDDGIDLQTDAENCGACGKACQTDKGQTCAAGVCKDPPENCSDGLDNDNDGSIDCADSQCNNLACGAGCKCVGTVPTETTCADGLDNDKDGLSDCADAECGDRLCKASPSTFACALSVCSCRGELAPAAETACTDGIDNDCNGKADCADISCANVSCGEGCECRSGAKRELLCQDGLDNDGDAQADCADPDCAGTSCGAGCVCGSGRKQETECADQTDNEGDGRIDCADNDCLNKTCALNKRCLFIAANGCF